MSGDNQALIFDLDFFIHSVNSFVAIKGVWYVVVMGSNTDSLKYKNTSWIYKA